MKRLVLVTVLSSAVLLGGDTGDFSGMPAASDNVNSRYKVESVELSKAITKKISKHLRKETERLVGQHFDPQIVSDLANRLHKELHLVVTHRLEKGQQPEYVRVVFEARERRWDEDDAKVTKLKYHQKLGWTGGFEVGTDIGRNRIEFGLQSDSDRLIERYAGISAGYSRPIGSDRVLLRFDFEALHQQWDPATQAALEQQPEIPGIYRERYAMEPEIVVLLTPTLSLATGVSFQHFQTQFPAARFEAANAVTTTLRHRRRWGSSGSSAGHELDAGYGLRAATSLLDSDFVYARHTADVRYSLKYSHSTLTLRALAGTMSGTAPLFERFALGDTQTLRGWNKFDLEPLGGSRVTHGSVQYRYRWIGVFYDTGTVWDRKEDPEAKHAAGVVVAVSKSGPYLSVGFPLRSGNMVPLFMMSMNF